MATLDSPSSAEALVNTVSCSSGHLHHLGPYFVHAVSANHIIFQVSANSMLLTL